MITVQCTSCKKVLEIEEDSLATREPTALHCPSCGVTLTVDRRKLRKSVLSGPAVKVAQEQYTPVAAPPPSDELAAAQECGEYARLLASLYTDGEEFLQKCTDIKARAGVLHDARS